ncbi:MAG TPA: FliA/WhiG family RNA polymerase sigma factor [Polyangia bacterium]|jgi:RNA polymerase sigma factor for flagellar operon FliA
MQTNTTNTGSKGRSTLQGEGAVARRNEYVTRYLGCVEKVARRLARKLPRHVDIDDLKSAGMIGLIEAAERFDPSRNEKFEAFAEFRIRGAMLDDLRSRDSLSRDMRRLCSELRDAAAQLANQIGRTPTEGELASHLGLAVEEVRDRHAKLSGWSVVGLDDAGPSFLDRTADDQSPDPCDATARRELFDQMIGHIETLPEKMQQVLALYYCEDLNLKEIGHVLGVTESRVCQIHGEATKRLRGLLGESFAEELAAA